MVMAAGMGMTMAPATESVMGSLPREKAGVGSAINDTTRQVGGALGVAIIGSVVSSVYAAHIASAASQFGLNASETATAQSSLGAAQGVAADMGRQSADFLAAASNSFVDALSIGLRISAFVVIIAGIVAWRFLPSHAREATLPGLPLLDPVDDSDDRVLSDLAPSTATCWPSSTSTRSRATTSVRRRRTASPFRSPGTEPCRPPSPTRR